LRISGTQQPSTGLRNVLYLEFEGLQSMDRLDGWLGAHLRDRHCVIESRGGCCRFLLHIVSADFPESRIGGDHEQPVGQYPDNFALYSDRRMGGISGFVYDSEAAVFISQLP